MKAKPIRESRGEMGPNHWEVTDGSTTIVFETSYGDVLCVIDHDAKKLYAISPAGDFLQKMAFRHQVEVVYEPNANVYFTHNMK